MLYSAYLQTFEPPSFYESDQQSDFYRSVRAYLSQVSAAEDEDVTNAAADLVESLYGWFPPLGLGLHTQVAVETPSTSSSMGLNVYRPSLNSLRSGTMTDSTWDSYSVSSSSTGSAINFSAPGRPGHEEQVLGVPELRLTASTRTETKEGVKHAWRLATLIIHVKHYKLNSRLFASDPPSPTGTQTILTALSEATGLLAKAWVECGTFWSLVLVNSRFSRLCVLDVEGLRQDSAAPVPGSDRPVVFTIALEVSPWLHHRHPRARLDLSSLLGTEGVDPHLLLSHDMVYGYHATAKQSLDIQNGEYSLDHESMAILWGSLVRAIDLIGQIPMGEPLRRLDAPSEPFKLYSEHLLSISEDVAASSVTCNSGPRSSTPETLVPLRAPLIGLDDTREQPVCSTGIGSHGVAVGTESGVDRGNTNPELRTWLDDLSLIGGDAVSGPLDDNAEAAAPGQPETRLVLRFVSSREMDHLERLRFGEGAGPQRTGSPTVLSCCRDGCCIA